MRTFPLLFTERLQLDQPTEADSHLIAQILGGNKVYADNTLNIPYPYHISDAEFFIKELCHENFAKGESYIWALRLKGNTKLIGIMELSIDPKNEKAEAGYWLAKEHWNKGLVTEALHEVIRFGFEDLKLNKIYATHHPNNPGSGKVMQKCGMKLEGVLQEEIRKGDRFIDLVRYSILKNNKYKTS